MPRVMIFNDAEDAENLRQVVPDGAIGDDGGPAVGYVKPLEVMKGRVVCLDFEQADEYISNNNDPLFDSRDGG